MMNSPCAMLMTPIWPKVNDRPSAMSSSTAPMLTPVKSWLRTSVTGRTSEIARDRGGRAPGTPPPPGGQDPPGDLGWPLPAGFGFDVPRWVHHYVMGDVAASLAVRGLRVQ